MKDSPRKKSPRAPSIALDEALDRALRIYDKERRHAAPVDAVAQHIGYKSANNGAALQALASMRYFGLLERPEEGKLAITKDVEDFQFAPTNAMKNELLVKWVQMPPVFADLLGKYAQGLPSDATLRYDLIQRGFAPATAESVLAVFKRSADFAKFFDQGRAVESEPPPRTEALEPAPASASVLPEVLASSESAQEARPSALHDRIPVRLSGGRRAWLEIPAPFFEADKKRLKDQIDLLLTEDEES